MFLKELHKLGKELENKGEIPLPYHVQRNLGWVIDIDKEGHFKDFGPLSKAKHLVGKQMGGRSGRAPGAYCLVDQAKYIFPWEFFTDLFENEEEIPNNYNHHENAKNECDFINYTKKMAKEGSKYAKAILQFYENEEYLKINIPESFDPTNSDLICFRVEGQFAHQESQEECIKVKEKYNQQDSTLVGQCCLTGEMTKVARLHGNRFRMTSFKENAFQHRGLEDSYNCPISYQGVQTFKGALSWLKNSKRHSIRIGRDKYAMWWIVDNSGNPIIPEKSTATLPNLLSKKDNFFEETSEVKPAHVAKNLKSVWKNINNIKIDQTQVRMILLKKRTGRMAPKYYRANLKDLLERISNFKVATRIWDARKKSYRDFTIHQLAKGLEPNSNARKDQIVSNLAEHIYLGRPFPNYYTKKVIGAVSKNGGKVTNTTHAWTRLVLSHMGENMTKYSRKENIAYSFGKLFYLTQKAQEDAISAKNKTIQKKFSRATNRPEECFPEINKRFEIYIQKLARSPKTKGKAFSLKKLRSEIFRNWPRSEDGKLALLPSKMTDKQKCAFILGQREMEHQIYSGTKKK